MKKNYTLLFLMVILSSINFMYAQTWQTVGTGFFSPGHFSSDIQILNYDDTVFVAYSDTDVNGNGFVIVKKRSGNNWITVSNKTTENRKYKFIHGKDLVPTLATIDQQNLSGTLEFMLKVFEYENGDFSEKASTSLLGIPPSIYPNHLAADFDFATNEDGDMACVFRFNSTALSYYHAKIGNNPWASTTITVENFGQTTGTAVKDHKLKFLENGSVMVVSRGINTNNINLHYFEHVPQSSHNNFADAAEYPFVIAGFNEPFKVTSRGDTLYMTLESGSMNYLIGAVYEDGVAPMAYQLGDYSIDYQTMRPIFTDNANYMMTVEENPANQNWEGFVYTMSSNFMENTWEMVGNSKLNLNENFISPLVYNVDPMTGEIIAAYVHGPPMNQTMVRKFGCTPVVASYDATDNELFITSNYSSSASFEWRECGETAVLSTDDVFEPSQSGDYEVTVIDGNCETTSDCITVTIGVNSVSNNALDLINIYPNPTEGDLHLSNINSEISVSVVDNLGRIVFVQNEILNDTVLDLNHLNTGVYFVNLQQNGINKMTRVVVK